MVIKYDDIRNYYSKISKKRRYINLKFLNLNYLPFIKHLFIHEFLILKDSYSMDDVVYVIPMKIDRKKHGYLKINYNDPETTEVLFKLKIFCVDYIFNNEYYVKINLLSDEVILYNYSGKLSLRNINIKKQTVNKLTYHYYNLLKFSLFYNKNRREVQFGKPGLITWRLNTHLTNLLNDLVNKEENELNNNNFIKINKYELLSLKKQLTYYINLIKYDTIYTKKELSRFIEFINNLNQNNNNHDEEE